jgi:hypothetical protein
VKRDDPMYANYFGTNPLFTIFGYVEWVCWHWNLRSYIDLCSNQDGGLVVSHTKCWIPKDIFKFFIICYLILNWKEVFLEITMHAKETIQKHFSAQGNGSLIKPWNVQRLKKKNHVNLITYYLYGYINTDWRT